MIDWFGLVGWVTIGAAGGFYYGRKKFAHWFTAAMSNPEALKALKNERVKAHFRGYRLGVRLFFAAVGAVAGAVIWGLGLWMSSI